MSSEPAYFPDELASTPDELDLHGTPSEVPKQSASLTAVTERVAEAPPISSEISVELLIRQVGSGDREALAHLFRRHARAVRNVAYRILRNEAEADDLVQDVFLTIFRKAALYDPREGKAATWIFHVAYHLAFDRRRYLNTRHFYSSRELDEASLRVADPRREVYFHEQTIAGVLGRELVAEFEAQLSQEQQETIQLHFFEGYALKEIAELTGRSLANVRSHYYRGLERLRKLVQPEKSGSR